MSKILASIVALIAASACAAAAQTSDPPLAGDSASRAECTIEVSRTRNGVAFEALARSSDDASGEYELVITKNDRDGSSDITQGGAFDLRGGDEDVLGASELSLARGGRYRARLVLWDSAGEVCRSERRS